MIADGFDDALIGMGSHGSHIVLVYDLAMVRASLRRGGMPDEDVDEFISFNITSAWVGEGTPIFVERMSMKEALESPCLRGERE